MIAKWKLMELDSNETEHNLPSFPHPSSHTHTHTHTHTHRLLGNREEDSSELEEVSPEERNAILRIRELKKEIKVS